MSSFDESKMKDSLEILFEDTFASAIVDGDRVIVKCGSLGQTKARIYIEDQFKDNGILDKAILKILGQDWTLGEDFTIEDGEYEGRDVLIVKGA